MASFYTVVQYVPDPVADERVNAGIIVFSQDRVAVRFIKNWARLQRFGNKDVRFLRDFARELEERIEPRLDRPTLSEAAIREMAATWKDAIQFTTPRGSLLSVEELLKDAEVRFLANDRAPESRPYTRHFLRKLAIDATELAFVQRGGVGARELVKRDFRISGAVESHPFSLAIANGQPLVAAEVFSFVGADRKGQEKDVRATAWAFEDVRKEHAGIDLAALVLTGQETSSTYEDAEKVFRSLGVRVVPKDRVDEWADEVAGKVLIQG